MDEQFHKIRSDFKSELIMGELLASQISFMCFAFLTAPLTTLGVSLQLSPTKLEKFYGDPGTEVSRLELAKSHEIKVQERMYNEIQLSSGASGNNRPFRAPYFKNYREAFTSLAAQGYKGFYKGNLIDIIRFSFLSWPVCLMTYSEEYIYLPNYLRYCVFFFAELGTEYIFQPLRTLHSRFILQNRIPEFAVYPSLKKCMERLRLRGLYQGVNVVVPKKVLAYGCFITADHWVDGLYTYLVTQFFVYPLDTLQRRLECQSEAHSMLPRRYLPDIRWSMSRIYHEEGIFKGFYRGFLCNTIANTVKHGLGPAVASYMLANYRAYLYVKERLME